MSSGTKSPNIGGPAGKLESQTLVDAGEVGQRVLCLTESGFDTLISIKSQSLDNNFNFC